MSNRVVTLKAISLTGQRMVGERVRVEHLQFLIAHPDDTADDDSYLSLVVTEVDDTYDSLLADRETFADTILSLPPNATIDVTGEIAAMLGGGYRLIVDGIYDSGSQANVDDEDFFDAEDDDDFEDDEDVELVVDSDQATDVSNRIERLPEFEERLGVTFDCLSAYLEGAGNICLTVRGELHPCIGTKLPTDIDVIIDVFDQTGRLIGRSSNCVYSAQFFGLETFEISMYPPIPDIVRIRIRPQKGC